MTHLTTKFPSSLQSSLKRSPPHHHQPSFIIYHYHHHHHQRRDEALSKGWLAQDTQSPPRSTALLINKVERFIDLQLIELANTQHDLREFTIIPPFNREAHLKGDVTELVGEVMQAFLRWEAESEGEREVGWFGW